MVTFQIFIIMHEISFVLVFAGAAGVIVGQPFDTVKVCVKL